LASFTQLEVQVLSLTLFDPSALSDSTDFLWGFWLAEARELMWGEIFDTVMPLASESLVGLVRLVDLLLDLIEWLILVETVLGV